MPDGANNIERGSSRRTYRRSGIFGPKVVDETLDITSFEAEETMHRLAKVEGVFKG